MKSISKGGVLISSKWSLATRVPAATFNTAHDRCLACQAVQLSEHSLYLEEIAVCQSPKRLGALIKVLQAQGGRKVLPSDRSGLHPLLIPLASDGSESNLVTCLLRWPEPAKAKPLVMPVVKMERGSKSVKLLARSVDEYLHRLLAEDDCSGPGPLYEAAGPDGQSLYKPGDVAASGFESKPHMYIIKNVGMFPDISESLSLGHMSRGDNTSALVASEWYMRNNHFNGWARPYEFAAELFTKLGKRQEEARDMARVALRLPWWTLEGSYEAARDMGMLSGSPREVRYNLSEEAAAAAQATMSQGVSFREPKPPQAASLDKAAELLDMVVAGEEPSYDGIRERLAQAYSEAGLKDVANFITSAT
ncbi:hypothetical protein CEUSTIGMA_g3008.t1 [Chlamydomonas eustigma]|uniref:Uncharacterized protein n=1 Tax=Chlamydomonas eustigma TaxID=1157962 RepID=A0A250WXQ6_9CHLO|nr:hypothetical protein CEUSTIGMA_g3008.t1 [Chlamydomonas eustigma]|eukprot:GAX75565.1 hypothetical protein CEUSTIGMA_g3008.t1 [Chlamydomonas eustigma]